jgi:predicted Zn-dependent peptidase
MRKNLLQFQKFLFFSFFVLSFSIYPLISQNVSDSKYPYETVGNDPLKARIYKLQNGLTVFMTVYKEEPRIQTYIAVRTGSKKDPSDATGLAHYLEHMLFKGTDKFGTKDFEKEKVYLDQIVNLYEVYRNTADKDQRKKIYHQIDSVSGLASQYAIANEYDKMMSSIGAKGTNAYTSVEQTVYTNDIPSNQLEKWITIESERFRHPVMRLFHTELEAVYEEKNIGLDNDGSKLWEALYRGLFPTHQYGTQTTIGTIEHLKNPSIQKVIDYYNTYYVPNNMAICLSGDFDMDETIKVIDEKWGALPSKVVPEFIPPVETPITSPKIIDVYGPEAAEMYMGYRFSGANTRDADMITMISQILSNGTAGLIDMNLNQQQKVLEAGCFFDDMKDYSAFILYAKPREGQSLEEIKDLLLTQVELVKKGEFPDWLLSAIINNIKLQQIKRFESNRSRAHAFVNSFILGIPWNDYVSSLDRISKITKQDIVDFANANFNNNYVVVNKRTGEDKNVQKVEKPEITPVNVNRKEQSEFLKGIVNTPVSDIQPVFIDYQNDIKQAALKYNVPLYYKENTENNTFNLYYVLDRGTNNNKKLGLAISYLEYLGTSKYTSTQLKQEFYKLGCSFSVSSSDDQVYVSLSGLNENFEKALDLFEEMLADVQPNKQALDNLVNDILKVRADDKLSQDKILWEAMYSFAKYGAKSPFTNILSKDELKAVTPDELVAIIK